MMLIYKNYIYAYHMWRWEFRKEFYRTSHYIIKIIIKQKNVIL